MYKLYKNNCRTVRRNFYFITLFLITSLTRVSGVLKLIKIVTRTPKEKDIGLIFDVTLENLDNEVKEQLEFRIRASGYCFVNVTSESMKGKMGRVVGGDFGFIEAGATETVSLIWPTVSLYNRVGVCNIVITSTNPQKQQVNIKQTIKFDTRIEMLDPDSRTLRKHKDFVECHNWDKDYFKNCTPVDCEERYFGLRSYYNETSEHCEEVARCSQSYQLYDIYNNECIDTRVFCTEEDLKMIKEGKFDDNVLELKPPAKENLKNIQNEPLDNNANHDYANFFGHDYFKRSALRNLDDEEKWLYPVPQKKENQRSAWLEGLGDGLLLVFATVTIYILICFCIFLIVTWLSRSPRRCKDGSSESMLLTPKTGSSENNIMIYTPSSLMSQR